MKTNHKFLIADSRKKIIEDESIDLVITSPPYPMIKMWDEMFISMNKKIDLNNPKLAFRLMNLELKKVYKRIYKALKIGGIMVVNIGDATRTINNNFKLYHNGARTIEMCDEIGFDVLPQVYWWKPTNSPNKFMGSGMYPIGAYVTLEVEHILIFRKGKRDFSIEVEKKKRQESAFFHNERNIWFSNIWTDIKGASQKALGLGRERNAAYPIELAYRLINMFSLKNDLIWDPFGGTGTTSIAALMSARNSIISEIDPTFINHARERLLKLDIVELNKKIDARISYSTSLVNQKNKTKKTKNQYNNRNYGSVYTKQEQNIRLNRIIEIKMCDLGIEAIYEL